MAATLAAYDVVRPVVELSERAESESNRAVSPEELEGVLDGSRTPPPPRR